MKYKTIGIVLSVIGVSSVLTVRAWAQPGVNRFGNNYHLGFERPESWGLKYFASTTLLSGLQPPEPTEGRRIGSVTVGLELGWLPSLDAWSNAHWV